MMIPPLMSVDYSLFPVIAKEPMTIFLSLIINYVCGPLLMFALGFTVLETGACDASETTGGRSNCTALFEGVILIGIARCIAMVVVSVREKKERNFSVIPTHTQPIYPYEQVWVKYAGGDVSVGERERSP